LFENKLKILEKLS